MGSACSCLKVEVGPTSTNSTKSGVLYSMYRENIKSFDIVLFRGGDYVSDFIRFLESRYSPTQTSTQKYNITADAFSHVGLLVRGDILEGENVSKNKIYVWESTMSGLLSEDGLKNVDGNSHFGIQLRDFDELVEKYDAGEDTRIAIAHLEGSTCFDENEIKTKFYELFKKYNNTLYDANPVSLVSSLCTCLRPVREVSEEVLGTEDLMFCSEFVAYVLKELGFYDSDTNPKNVVPMDFIGFDADPDAKGGLPCIFSKPEYVITEKWSSPENLLSVESDAE